MQSYIAQQERKIAEKEQEKQRAEKELKVFKDAANIRQMNLLHSSTSLDWQRKGLMIETEKKRQKYQEELEKKQKAIREAKAKEEMEKAEKARVAQLIAQE